MRTNINFLIILFSLLALPLSAQVEVTTYGDIPEERLAPSRWQHFEWDGSGVWDTINVTSQGVLPDQPDDIAPIVNAIISNGSGKRILLFPAGTYQIKSRLNISKSDIQIVGVGSSTRFMLEGGDTPGYIYGGGARRNEYTLAADVARGDDKVTLNSTSGLIVGDYFIIKQAGSVTRPGASGDETQIFKITAKIGNTLTLDMKFGIPFYKASASVQELGYKQNLRLHNFYIEMTTKPTSDKSDNIALNTIRNVEISNVESNKALNTHVQIFRAREVIFKENNFYGNYGGGGGFQYAIKMNWCTNCHIINNVAADLRHHYATQYGSDHCVIAYNRALPPYNDYADFGQHNSKGCHNNLFEGNYGSEIYDDANPLKSWGTRYTMWFRNHATSKVGSENAYVEYMNIIGNELTGGSSAIKTGNPGKYTLAAANIINIDGEGGTGTLLSGDLPADAAIPASLFLTEKPDYVDRWPLYGPQASDSSTLQLPSADIVKPTENSYVEGYDSLHILVEASAVEGRTITSAELKIDGSVIRTDTIAPYEWGKVGSDTQDETLSLLAGSHLLEVTVTDSEGQMRTVRTTIMVKEARGPYGEQPIAIPGVLQFELYDKGGQGIAYHDNEPENRGAAEANFRVNEGVDIGAGNGGYVIGWTSDNEWLEYTVSVESDDTYEFEFTVSSYRGGGLLGLKVDGQSAFSSVSIPKTDDWDVYTTFKENVSLTAGEHTLRFTIENSGFNLDKVMVVKQSAAKLGSTIEEKLGVHPNPAQGGIFYLSSTVAWEVYSLQGIYIKAGQQQTVDLSEMPQGIYLLKTEEAIVRLVVK